MGLISWILGVIAMFVMILMGFSLDMIIINLILFSLLVNNEEGK